MWRQLDAPRPAPLIVTVGGTNGKGSCVAVLEAMLTSAGHAVGCYTSPHLIRYNERVRLRGREASDAELIAAFAQVELARGDTTLTWFEYGTLAAFLVFSGAGLGVAVLEVGLGGRLDAVNLVDADVTVVTNVALDHVDWLGPDRDSIGHEKAGIFRAAVPAIIGDPDPPRGLLAAAGEIGADVLRVGRDFGVESGVDGRRCWIARACEGEACGGETITLDLAEQDHGNKPGRLAATASALVALHALRGRIGWPQTAYANALAHVHLRGRLEQIASSPEVWVDVAHNPHAAAALAEWLGVQQPATRTCAVFGALADKDVAGIVEPLCPLVSAWFLCGLPEAGSRALPVAELAVRLRQACPQATVRMFADPVAAMAAAQADTMASDRIIAFGSFHVAGALLPNSPASLACIIHQDS